MLFNGATVCSSKKTWYTTLAEMKKALKSDDFRENVSLYIDSCNQKTVSFKQYFCTVSQKGHIPLDSGKIHLRLLIIKQVTHSALCKYIELWTGVWRSRNNYLSDGVGRSVHISLFHADLFGCDPSHIEEAVPWIEIKKVSSWPFYILILIHIVKAQSNGDWGCISDNAEVRNNLRRWQWLILIFD